VDEIRYRPSENDAVDVWKFRENLYRKDVFFITGVKVIKVTGVP
jgi:hypothetical protein